MLGPLLLCGCVSIELIGSDGISVQRTSGLLVEVNAPNALALKSKGLGGRLSSGTAFFGAFDEVAVLDSGKCKLVILEADPAQVQNIILALSASGIGTNGVCAPAINQGGDR
jgi:hypothetical protein